MGLFRKSRWERMVVNPVSDSLGLPHGVRSSLATAQPPKAVTSGLAALASLTVGSAAVSSLRRRGAGSRDES